MAEITLTHDAVTVRVAKRDNPARMRELFAALPREVAEELRIQLSGYDPREFGEFFIGMRHYAPTARAYFCVADATHVQVTDLDLTAGQAKGILPCIVTYLAEHPDAAPWDVDLIANAMEAIAGRELGPATFRRGDGDGAGAAGF